VSKALPTAPSARTRIRRISELANYERQSLYQILDEAYVCHIAFQSADSTHCIPTAFWRIDDYLYIHGSNGGRLTKALLTGQQVSIAITLIDGLVLARSAFSHSMHYRSAVIYGVFDQVKGNKKKMDAMDMFMEKIAPGRKHEARPGNAKELAATSVLRISIDEAVSKISNGGPDDKDEDLGLPVWAGVLPMTMTHGVPIPADNGLIPTPDYVTSWSTPMT
jgi:nitroimidazol reductase NimA-like FMN-containing flavoprotein (pyridoxamine 5'-phosphate oxidase superfamily)